MKNISKTAALLVLVLVLLPSTAFGSRTEDFVTTLYAGQTIPVGTASASNDGDFLYICYDTTDWYMTETHMHVATSLDDIPQKNGNPIPGQFDYKSEYDEPYSYHDCYSVPLTWPAGTELYIAAHAAVCSNGYTSEGEGDCSFQPGVIGTVTLWAGQHIEAGTVTAAIEEVNGEFYLAVTYETTGGWELTETHLAVAHSLDDIPQRNGNPIPGRFPYKHEGLGGVTVDAYSIPLSDLDAACDDLLYIAAHAALQKLVGYDENGNPIYQQETGWGGDDDFTGSNWARYFTVTLPCDCDQPGPPGPACETAWADGYDFPGNNWATYFTYTIESQTPQRTGDRRAPDTRRIQR